MVGSEQGDHRDATRQGDQLRLVMYIRDSEADLRPLIPSSRQPPILAAYRRYMEKDRLRERGKDVDGAIEERRDYWHGRDSGKLGRKCLNIPR